jgi:hypothetical protein
MSRHHVTLPPIIYTPVPKPKLARRRPGIGRLLKTAARAAIGDVDEADDISEVDPAPFAGRPPSIDAFELPDQQGRSTTGLLSENTLKIMLLAQELAK